MANFGGSGGRWLARLALVAALGVPVTGLAASPVGAAASLRAAPGTMKPVATAAQGSSYFPLAPTRLLDTRTTGQQLAPQTVLELDVLVGSVPANATAVSVNVTVTDSSAASYLTAYPAGTTMPEVSSLNWVAGATVANLVMVQVGSGGEISFYNYAGTAALIVDLEGYYAPADGSGSLGSYVALAPSRIADTRPQSGMPYQGQTLSPGGTLSVQVAGAGGVPSSGAEAAVVNVTVTDTSASGYMTAYPSGQARGTSSTLNWSTGETVANRAVVQLGVDGKIAFYNSAGYTDLVVDVTGYFSDGSTSPNGASLFNPISPLRVLDTRSGDGPLQAGGTVEQQVGGQGAIASNATAVAANLTATDTTTTSYFTVYPGPGRPTASDLNWAAGQTVANMVVATLGSSGSVSIYNAFGSADAILDVFGYFTPVSSTTTNSSGYGWASSNWSGYLAEGGVFGSASGEFSVPSLKPTTAETFVALWVGIDGYDTQQLIQAGVQLDYDPSTGQSEASAWWEVLPNPETPISMAVSPGDEVSVTLSEVSSQLWSISLINETTGASFTTEQPYDGPTQSAEWIVEAPEEGNDQTQLANYGSSVFTNLDANGGNPQLTLADGGYMVQSGAVVSIPSQPSIGGDSFSIAYGSQAPSAP